MGSQHKRRSPAQYRRHSSAFTWFALCLMALVVVGALFYQFVIQFDFAGFTPGDYVDGDFVPEDGYSPITYPPQMYDPDASPTPEPRVTPRPTPIPLERYSMLDKRIQMPKTDDAVLGDLTECRISVPDESRALVVRGYGYLVGQDASQSTIYLVVSTKFGENHRFYTVKRESGSSGLVHDAATGTNLDQADFSAIVRIEDNYIDSDYRLGVLVIGRDNGQQIRGYARLDGAYNFNVQRGKITALAG